MMIFYIIFMIFMISITLIEFICCYKDYHLVSQHSYDGGGQISYRKPKF